jgi:HK97 family phage major capsid protein
LLARAIDKAAAKGGAASEPAGILTVIAATTTATITWPSVVGLIGTVETENSEGSGFAMHPLVRSKLMGKVRLSGATDSVVMMENPRILAGYPAESSTGVPSGTLIFGNWSDLLVGYWSVLDVLVNPYESTAYAKGNVLIRAMATCDVAIRHAESFAALGGIAA